MKTSRSKHYNSSRSSLPFEDGMTGTKFPGVIDDRPEVQAAMYEAGPFLKESYNEQTGHYHMCFYLDNLSAMEFQSTQGIRLV